MSRTSESLSQSLANLQASASPIPEPLIDRHGSYLASNAMKKAGLPIYLFEPGKEACAGAAGAGGPGTGGGTADVGAAGAGVAGAGTA